MRRKAVGILNGAIAAASYGTNPLFALPLFAAGVGVNSVLFYRYAIAVVIYGIWLKFVKKVSLKITQKEFFPIFFLSMLFSFSSLTLFQAFKYIAAGIACTILFIYPVIVAIIMAIFFKEKITKTVISAILLTSFGIVLLYNGKDGVTLNLQGVLLVLSSALLYALYIVGVKNIKPVKHIKPDKLSFYIMFFGLSVYIYNLFAIALAVFPTIISLETITVSIKLVGSTITAILGALEPLTAIFFGVVFFHEELTPRIIAGVALILAGVILIVLRKTHKTSHAAAQKTGF